MAMLTKIGRMFVIKTRVEAYLVTYAIAVGAIERGIHYLQMYPGNAGLMLAAACLGVPFIAGAKLVDSVRPSAAAGPSEKKPARRLQQRRRFSRNRPRDRRPLRGLALPRSRHTD